MTNREKLLERIQDVDNVSLARIYGTKCCCCPIAADCENRTGSCAEAIAEWLREEAEDDD